MGERPIGVTDEASGAGVAQFRTRERTVGAEAVVEQYLIPTSERVRSFQGMATTFRIPGVTGSGQNFLSIFNAAGSSVLVAVLSIQIEVDYTTNSMTMRFFATTRITAAPTGGTALSKVAFDTAESSSSSVTLLGGASADGTASAITATPGADRAYRPHHTHFAAVTDLQQSRCIDLDAIPLLADEDPPYLRASEGLLLALPDASSTSASIIAKIAWQEFTLP
jgi:hypothetical protein